MARNNHSNGIRGASSRDCPCGRSLADGDRNLRVRPRLARRDLAQRAPNLELESRRPDVERQIKKRFLLRQSRQDCIGELLHRCVIATNFSGVKFLAQFAFQELGVVFKSDRTESALRGNRR